MTTSGTGVAVGGRGVFTTAGRVAVGAASAAVGETTVGEAGGCVGCGPAVGTAVGTSTLKAGVLVAKAMAALRTTVPEKPGPSSFLSLPVSPYARLSRKRPPITAAAIASLPCVVSEFQIPIGEG
jgi:hypothetical protein